MAIAAQRVARYASRRSRGSSRRFRTRRWVGIGILATVVFLAVNLIYQISRKPGELLAPFSSWFLKTPKATWDTYGPDFEKHATSIISPVFLAALAQVESDGNPIARPAWRWDWSWDPFEVYRPASSALGLFQITDGTFAEAHRYCVRNGAVSMHESGGDSKSCGSFDFYTRISARDSIQITAAYLHRRVVDALARHPKRKTTLEQKQKLAAVIHLCGAKRGESFVARGFRAADGEQCGTHDLGRYLAKVDRMKKDFEKLTRP